MTQGDERESSDGELQGHLLCESYDPDVRAVVRGLPVELSLGGRTPAGTWRVSRPCDDQPLGGEVQSRVGRGLPPPQAAGAEQLAPG